MQTFRHAPGRCGLLAINAALGVAVLFVTFSIQADAQQNAGRAPGDYTMVAGKVQGVSEAAIYIIDAKNQEMVALRWDQSAHKLEPIGYRDLAQDTKRALRGGR